MTRVGLFARKLKSLSRLGAIVGVTAVLCALLVAVVTPLDASAAGTTTATSVDHIGVTGGGQRMSLALNDAGHPVVSYHDYTNGDLKVLVCGDATCSSGNTIATPDTAGDVGRFSSLVLNDDGFPVVAYFDSANRDLKVLVCGDATCSAGNSITTPDSADDTGAYPSLALNDLGFPVIAYSDDYEDPNLIRHSDLNVLVCGDATCSAGNTITAAATDGGQINNISKSLNMSGFPVMAYMDTFNFSMHVLVCGDATCSSVDTNTTPDSDDDFNLDLSMVLDSADRPIVSYHNLIGASQFSVFACGDTTCSSGNTLSPLSIPHLAERGTSIQLNSMGFPVVSTHSNNPLPAGSTSEVGNDLAVVVCGDAVCSSGNTVVLPDTAGYVGEYSSLALTADDRPVVSYYDQTNGDLKILVCGDPLCMPAPVTCDGLVVTIDMTTGASGVGTAGDDVILGTSGDDTIDGQGGDDVVCAEGGHDTVDGGAGKDRIFGGEGNDVLRGEGGKDRIYGGPGADELLGGPGSDTLRGQQGNDLISGGDTPSQLGDDDIKGGGGADEIYGGGGDDILDGGGGVDTIYGQDGDDVITGRGAKDFLYGGAGLDTMTGQNGADEMWGGDGADTMIGIAGPDILRGGDGNDRLGGGGGNDFLYGGAGNDRCSGNAGPNDQAELATCEKTPGVEAFF